MFAGRLVGQKGIEDIFTALALTDQMPRTASESRRVHTPIVCMVRSGGVIFAFEAPNAIEVPVRRFRHECPALCCRHPRP